MTTKACAKMLQLESRSAGRYMSERGWKVERGGVVRFARHREALAAAEGGDGAAGGGDAHARAFNEEVPTEELAKMSITYAREMEQIV